jgi:hypothetical protein
MAAPVRRNTYFHCSQIDLMNRSLTDPLYARISCNRNDGRLSPYGCGWNVCYLLGLVTRGEAQNGVNAIIHDHDNYGEHSNPGLLIGTTAMPNSICSFIYRGNPSPLRLTIDRLFFYPGLTAQVLQDEIIRRYFPDNSALQHQYTRGIFYCYMIIKFMIDFNTGLGHTILIGFHHSPTPSEPNNWQVFTCDPQLKRNNTFNTLSPYLIKSYNSNAYQGISCCVVDESTSGGKSSRKSSRKSLRYKSLRKSLRSKILRSKSKFSRSLRKSTSLTHVSGKDIILPNMYENLSTEFGKPFNYSPKNDDTTQSTFGPIV